MTPPSQPVLVAISGGSDSTALLLRLLELLGPDGLSAATVDHGLRLEAADEAAWVAALCAELGVPHTTLRWIGGRKAAASARAGRYDLLLEHAQAIGAKTIALGHTKDDQAETVFMRAMRLRSESNTRGLSGMTTRTHHRGVTLWRPLLGERRAGLRAELGEIGQSWIDDPTNVEMNTERVRVRHHLLEKQASVEQIARFADACNRSRTWLAKETASALSAHAERTDGSGEWRIKRVCALPPLILSEILSVLIMHVGGGAYRPALGKLAPVIDAVVRNEDLRHGVGRTVVELRADTISISPEAQRRNEPPSPTKLVAHRKPLDSFRSAADDPIAEALEFIAATPS